jgi:hypothetical protein
MNNPSNDPGFESVTSKGRNDSVDNVFIPCIDWPISLSESFEKYLFESVIGPRSVSLCNVHLSYA